MKKDESNQSIEQIKKLHKRSQHTSMISKERLSNSKMESLHFDYLKEASATSETISDFGSKQSPYLKGEGELVYKNHFKKKKYTTSIE